MNWRCLETQRVLRNIIICEPLKLTPSLISDNLSCHFKMCWFPMSKIDSRDKDAGNTLDKPLIVYCIHFFNVYIYSNHPYTFTIIAASFLCPFLIDNVMWIKKIWFSRKAFRPATSKKVLIRLAYMLMK